MATTLANTSFQPQRRNLGDQLLRGFGLFQVLTAFPIMFALGYNAYLQIMFPNWTFYTFCVNVLGFVLSASIVFIVYVQRTAIVSRLQTFLFEGIKSAVATILWLWLILDSAFGPWRHDWNDDKERVDEVVKRAALVGILLLTLFYPPTIYTWHEWKRKCEHPDEVDIDTEEGREADERTPLMGA